MKAYFDEKVTYLGLGPAHIHQWLVNIFAVGNGLQIPSGVKHVEWVPALDFSWYNQHNGITNMMCTANAYFFEGTLFHMIYDAKRIEKGTTKKITCDNLQPPLGIEWN